MKLLTPFVAVTALAAPHLAAGQDNSVATDLLRLLGDPLLYLSGRNNAQPAACESITRLDEAGFATEAAKCVEVYGILTEMQTAATCLENTDSFPPIPDNVPEIALPEIDLIANAGAIFTQLETLLSQLYDALNTGFLKNVYLGLGCRGVINLAETVRSLLGENTLAEAEFDTLAGYLFVELPEREEFVTNVQAILLRLVTGGGGRRLQEITISREIPAECPDDGAYPIVRNDANGAPEVDFPVMSWSVLIGATQSDETECTLCALLADAITKAAEVENAGIDTAILSTVANVLEDGSLQAFMNDVGPLLQTLGIVLVGISEESCTLMDALGNLTNVPDLSDTDAVAKFANQLLKVVTALFPDLPLNIDTTGPITCFKDVLAEQADLGKFLKDLLVPSPTSNIVDDGCSAFFKQCDNGLFPVASASIYNETELASVANIDLKALLSPVATSVGAVQNVCDSLTEPDEDNEDGNNENTTDDGTGDSSVSGPSLATFAFVTGAAYAML